MTLKRVSVLLLLILQLGLYARAQTIYRSTSDSDVTISGSSTLHAWTMTSKDPKVRAELLTDAEGNLNALNSLTLSLRGESLKSGHSAMDKNAYSALDTDTYKYITFTLVSATVNTKTIVCKGNLSIAGVTKLITVEASFKESSGKNILCVGTKEIKMSDYGVEPPVFMFGTVKTGDEINIDFNIRLTPGN